MASTAEQSSTMQLQQQQQQQQQHREDGLTAEELQEKAEVETSLGKHILDLQNVLSINDEIVKENNEIDQNIYTKERIFGRLIEQNKEDMIQLELEKPSQLEAFAYELSITEAKVEELRRLKLRYIEIEDENDSLRKTFSSLSDKFSDDAKKYAEEMHKLNKGMQAMRQEMENIFNRKLIDMDVKFQEQAFGNLDDRKKKELLDYSKLQDEVAMQENGLTNLMIRISREKNNFVDAKKHIKRMNKKASTIRSQLKEYRRMKSVTIDKLQACNAEISELQNDSTDLLNLLNSWPYIDDIENALIKCNNDCTDANKEFSNWERRLHCLLEIESDFRSLRIRRKKLTETKDKKKTANSTLSNKEGMDNLSSVVDYNHIEKVRMEDVREAINSIPCMQEIFEPLMGKENLLAINRGSTNIDDNPVAWLVKSIMGVWDITEKAAPQLLNTSPDVNFGEHDVNKNDCNENDTSGEIEDLWDSALQYGDEYGKTKSSEWLRTVSSPKFFPDDAAPLQEKDKVSCVDTSFKAILKDVESVRIPSPKKVNQLNIPPIRSSSEDMIGVHSDKRKQSLSRKKSQQKGMKIVKGKVNKSMSTNLMITKATNDLVSKSATMW